MLQSSGNEVETQRAKEEQARAQEDAKNSILSQILDQDARARCKKLNYMFFLISNKWHYILVNTLMLGKPEKGQMIQNMLIRMAQTGQIATKIGEKELIGLLENVNSQTKSKTSVKFDRRRAALDSDDDDF